MLMFNNSSFKLNILISNDDGYKSKGISILSDIVSKFANILVCSPEKNMSGSSNSLTLTRDLKISKVKDGFYYINGTPVDCVNLALRLIDIKPDFVFSGINHGSNLGDDTLYSGTVAAAMEGYLCGIPSIAFSLTDKSDKYWDTAKKVLEPLIKFLIFDNNKKLNLLNINIPNIFTNKINGFKVVRLGRREQTNIININTDEKGNNIYSIGDSGRSLDLGYEDDFSAIKKGYVSITPLTIDLTSYEEVNIMKDIFNNFIL